MLDLPQKFQPRLPKTRRQRHFDAKGKRSSSASVVGVVGRCRWPIAWPGSTWIYLACYLNGEANEFEYTIKVWCEWEFLATSLVTQKSCKAKKWRKLFRRRSEQSDAQSRKHSYHVPTEREDRYIYIHRLDDGRWDYPKLTKPAKPRTDAFFISQLANSKIQEVCRNHLPLFLVSKKLVLVQTNGFAVILLHRLEDVNHALLSMKM